MFSFLLNPRSLIFLIVYLFSIIWYLSDGFKSFDAIWEPFGSGSSVQKLSEFPWGHTYFQFREGRQFELGEESYHFLSSENAFINFENTAARLNVRYELSDGTQVNNWKFTNLSYNPKKRELSGTLDFTGNGDDYLVVYTDYATYEMQGEFWRGRGFQLEKKRYDSVLPLSFPNGGKIVFDAYSAYEGAEVFFRFENQAYPDNEPSYETEPIRIDTKSGLYEIAIPKMSRDLKFHSVILYLPQSDSEVFIKDLQLIRKTGGEGTSKALKLEFSDAFGADVFYYWPFEDHDSKWTYKWKFSKDFSRIESGWLKAFNKDDELNFELDYRVQKPSWYYIKQ